MGMEWIDGLARLMGYMLMICGGLFWLGIAIQKALDFVWSKIILIAPLAEVRRVMQAHHDAKDTTR